MKSNTLPSAIRALSLLLLVSGTCALAQDRRPVHFSGLINDYSPSTVKGGPWEMHGQWSLDIHEDWRKEARADFSADMTMSDYGTTAGLPDVTKGGHPWRRAQRNSRADRGRSILLSMKSEQGW